MYVESPVEREAMPRTMSLELEVPLVSIPLPPYLAFKEIWRNKGRFLLVGFVIALVTTAVLTIALFIFPAIPLKLAHQLTGA